MSDQSKTPEADLILRYVEELPKARTSAQYKALTEAIRNGVENLERKLDSEMEMSQEWQNDSKFQSIDKAGWKERAESAEAHLALLYGRKFSERSYTALHYRAEAAEAHFEKEKSEHEKTIKQLLSANTMLAMVTKLAEDNEKQILKLIRWAEIKFNYENNMEIGKEINRAVDLAISKIDAALKGEGDE